MLDNKSVQESTTPVAWAKIYFLNKLLFPPIMLEWMAAFSPQLRLSLLHTSYPHVSRGQLKCDGTRAETRFRLSAKRTSPFKSAVGRQFSRLLAAEVWASAVVMLDTPCCEVVWRVLATHSIRQFPLHFPSRASPCAITFQLQPTSATFCSAFALVLIFGGDRSRAEGRVVNVFPLQESTATKFDFNRPLASFRLYKFSKKR